MAIEHIGVRHFRWRGRCGIVGFESIWALDWTRGTSPMRVTPTRIVQIGIGLLHFIAGSAVLLTLFPVGGKLPDKPAGVRTAIELLEKRVANSHGPG